MYKPSGWWRLPVRDADQRFRAAGAHQGRGQRWSVVPRAAWYASRSARTHIIGWHAKLMDLRSTTLLLAFTLFTARFLRKSLNPTTARPAPSSNCTLVGIGGARNKSIASKISILHRDIRYFLFQFAQLRTPWYKSCALEKVTASGTPHLIMRGE